MFIRNWSKVSPVIVLKAEENTKFPWSLILQLSFLLAGSKRKISLTEQLRVLF